MYSTSTLSATTQEWGVIFWGLSDASRFNISLTFWTVRNKWISLLTREFIALKLNWISGNCMLEEIVLAHQNRKQYSYDALTGWKSPVLDSMLFSTHLRDLIVQQNCTWWMINGILLILQIPWYKASITLLSFQIYHHCS